MMTKYFYDCSIKAAYMAKEFGMDFYSSDDIDSYFEHDLESLLDVINEDTNNFYIHEDSLSMLEPVGGDHVTVDDGDLVYSDIIDNVESEIPIGGGADFWGINGNYFDKEDITSIDKRNNKPFIWPEQE